MGYRFAAAFARIERPPERRRSESTRATTFEPMFRRLWDSLYSIACGLKKDETAASKTRQRIEALAPPRLGSVHPVHSANPIVVFQSFRRTPQGVTIQALDTCGAQVATGFVTSIAPLGGGWFVACAEGGCSYRVQMAEEQVAIFHRLLSACRAGDFLLPAPATDVVGRGFAVGSHSVHFRFANEAGQLLVSSPIVRLEPLGNGYYVIHTQSGSQYRSRLGASDLTEYASKRTPTGMAPEVPAVSPTPNLHSSTTSDDSEQTAVAALPSQRPDRSAQAVVPAAAVRGNVPEAAARNGLRWLGASETLRVGGLTLPGGLIYTTEGKPDIEEASCVDLQLPIGQTIASEEVPHFHPRFANLSPAQRARYLSWLARGRDDPSAEPGIVFLFYFGLERRLLTERNDTDALIPEIRRLLLLCPDYMFQQYGHGLIAYIVAGNLETAGEEQCRYLEHCSSRHVIAGPSLNVALAWHHLQGRPLSAYWAQCVAAQDARAQQFYPFGAQVEDEFRRLYALEYQRRFRDGLIPKAGKRKVTIEYGPASPSLSNLAYGSDRLPRLKLPHVLDRAAQFQPLCELWLECVEALRILSYRIAAGAVSGTADYYEALPPSLREGVKHPDASRWMQFFGEEARDDRWAIVQVSKLAELRGFLPGTKLTRSDSRTIATTAEFMGLAVEPCPCRPPRTFRWEEAVTLFRPACAPGHVLEGGFERVASLLELGLAVAAADSSPNQAEIDCLQRRLEEQQDLLSARDRESLEALWRLYLSNAPVVRTPSAYAHWTSEDERIAVIDFLITIAIVDGSPTAEERSALKSAGRAIRLTATMVKQRLERALPEQDDPITVRRARCLPGGEAIPDRLNIAPAALVLDQERVVAIRRETEVVQRMLGEAILYEGDSDESIQVGKDIPMCEAEARPGSVTGECFAGLAIRYHGLLLALLAAASWPTAEFQAMVRNHGLYPSAAIEAINEWSYEALGDVLIEAGEPLVMNLEIVKEAA